MSNNNLAMTGPSFAPSRNVVNAASGVSLSNDHRDSLYSRQRQRLQQQKHLKQPAGKKIPSLIASPPSQHAKLHKRGASSVSSTSLMSSSPDAFRQSKTSPIFTSGGPPLITSPLTLPTGGAAKATTLADTPSSVSSVAPSRIKPYLRKLSSKDGSSGGLHLPTNRSKSSGGNMAIDLSRPAAENKSLASLGITDYGVEAQSVQETSNSALGRQARHGRSASNTSSQLSAGSAVATAADLSLHRPAAPYVHPMRQTPRPYTPPISSAIQDSVRESDSISINHMSSCSDLQSGGYVRKLSEADRQISGSVSSTPTAGMTSSTPFSQPPRAATVASASASTPLLQTSTKLHSSTTASTLNHSSTSFIGSGTPKTRSRGNTLLSIDTVTASGTATTPSSRTSLDRALTLIRGRDRDDCGVATGATANLPVNPAEKRAAHIRAARQEYRAKEEAKARKAEKTLLKKEEKHLKRRLKKEEAEQRSRLWSDTNSLQLGSEKAVTGSFGGYAGADLGLESTSRARGRNGGTATDAGLLSSSSRSGVRSHWLAFITWLRTRFLKIGRKLHLS